MASVMRREEKTAYWPYPSSPSYPSSRIPSMGYPLVDTTSGKGRANLSRRTQHQRTPSASFLMEEQLSWLDDLLDDRDIPCKRGSHRRSASDSFTFLDAPGSFYGINDIVEEDELEYCDLAVEETKDCIVHGKPKRSESQFSAKPKQLPKQNFSLNVSTMSCNSGNSRTQMKGILSPIPDNTSTSDCTSVSETVGEGLPGHLACEREQLSWLDDLLDDSDSLSRKVCHRRSASDSFAFLEAPGYLYKITDIAEEEELDCSSLTGQRFRNHSDKHSMGSGELMSLYAEIEHLQKQQNLPVSVPISRCNSNGRLGIRGGASSTLENPLASDGIGLNGTLSGVSSGCLASDQEIQSVGDGVHVSAWRQSTVAGESDDPNLDPRRVKRILANRQSAQRSRVRKLLYIAELERNVDALQTEVSTLSSEVAYLEHRRVLLNVDNNAAKQRISFLAKDKKLKDAQNEALKSEVQKMRKFYQFQLQQHEQQSKHILEQPSAQHNSQHHTSVFDIPAEEFSKLNLGPPKPMELRSPVSDAFVQFNKNLSRVSSSTGASFGPSCNNGRPCGTKT